LRDHVGVQESSSWRWVLSNCLQQQRTARIRASSACANAVIGNCGMIASWPRSWRACRAAAASAARETPRSSCARPAGKPPAGVAQSSPPSPVALSAGASHRRRADGAHGARSSFQVTMTEISRYHCARGPAPAARRAARPAGRAVSLPRSAAQICGARFRSSARKLGPAAHRAIWAAGSYGLRVQTELALRAATHVPDAAVPWDVPAAERRVALRTRPVAV